MSNGATVLVIDNGEFSRNLDCAGISRLDKIGRLCYVYYETKTTNVNNSLGLITMGGLCPQVRQTLTANSGRLLNILPTITSKEGTNMQLTLELAFATLRNRTRKELAQRIVLFITSNIEELSFEALEANVKLFHRCGISLDIVTLAKLSEEEQKRFAQIVQDANDTDMGECLCIDPNEDAERQFRSSGVLLGVTSSRERKGSPMNEFGVDPELDPDLYAALKASLEEH